MVRNQIFHFFLFIMVSFLGKDATAEPCRTPSSGQESFSFMHIISDPSDTPIIVYGDEQKLLNLQLPDGGLKPLLGVHNIQILRTSRGNPDIADRDGWTYAHHQDLACWKGRLYAAWAMTPKDEDVPPYKVVYATSSDGIHWSAPADLFPREVAWPSRFYFYIAGNGRMLAFCTGKTHENEVTESAKQVLLVREITRDHQLGEVFTLINPLQNLPAVYETSKDPGFVEACREAATNNMLLEQQDYGIFLGNRRMPWHENTPKYNGFYPFGKAFCFYHRKDGYIVGLCKMGFTTVSGDQGETWSMPMIPPTLFAGAGKIWGQRTNDGRYALAYNPDPTRAKRYPLVLVNGENGREFRDMRVVHGECPVLRYPGKYKDAGPQYVRGLAEWSDDGTLADKMAMWLIYSVSKEDIWVARVPLPVKPEETVFPSDDFEKAVPGGIVPGWNIYSPCWAPVSVVDIGGRRCLELRDADPTDYARAIRLFPATAKVRVELEVKTANDGSYLELELCDSTGNRPTRLTLAGGRKFQAMNGPDTVDLGKCKAGVWTKLVLTTDLAAGKYTVQLNGGRVKIFAITGKDIKSIVCLSLRTGTWRGCDNVAGVEALRDVPAEKPAIIYVDNVTISTNDELLKPNLP
jgi:hypothetical protein